MVSAFSLKLRSTPIAVKIIGLIVAIAMTVLIAFLIFNAINSDDRSNTMKTFEVTTELKEEIENLEFNVSQPEKVPEGYSRVFVGIISENASATGCQEVVQLYTGQDSIIEISDDPDELPKALSTQEAFTEIDMYTYPLECGFVMPSDAETYSIRDHPGWISDSDPIKNTLIEIAVNQALVRIDTSLSREEIEPVIERFVPFSASSPTDSVVISK